MNPELVSHIGYNWDHISTDDSQVVVVDTENKTGLGRAMICERIELVVLCIIILPVNDSEQMLFACLDNPSGSLTQVGVKSVRVLAVE